MTRRPLKKENKMKKLGLFLMLPVLAFGAVLVATGIFSSNSYFSKAESEELKASSSHQIKDQGSFSSEVKKSSSKASSTSSTSSVEETTTQTDASVTEVAEVATPEETTEVASQEAVATKVAYNTQTAVTPVPAQMQATQHHVALSGRVLSNGNTAGKDGSYAAAQMAAATGVDQATWEHIIARESNGQVGARNASGASGLFQTMPGWGSTATVQDQINSAINAYNAQGLAAWGY